MWDVVKGESPTQGSEWKMQANFLAREWKWRQTRRRRRNRFKTAKLWWPQNFVAKEGALFQFYFYLALIRF